jgi:chromosome condensin MukBEF MukE localization factor
VAINGHAVLMEFKGGGEGGLRRGNVELKRGNEGGASLRLDGGV